MCYFNKLFLRMRHYQFNLKLLKKKKIKTKTKFFRKIIKKSKTTRLSRIFKLNVFFNLFTSTPPLSTFLNLLGVNTQTFIEDLNKNFSNLFVLNIPIILSIFINLDLSYRFIVNLSFNTLVKSFFFLFSNDILIENLYNINFYRKNFYNKVIKISSQNNRLENEVVSFRYFLNIDLYFLCYFFFYNQSFIYLYNLTRNNFFILNNKFLLLSYENFLLNCLSILKSYNLNILVLEKFINNKVL